MRAEEVIATHVNTDFDAFASLLAARCLYPGSTAVLPSGRFQPGLIRNSPAVP